jgi:predicted DNA-binding protein
MREATTMDRNDAIKEFHSGGDGLADLIGEGRPVELPAPDTDEPMVSRSVRLPVRTYERVREAADARGIGVTTLMRQWIEAGLAELDDSTTVSLADVRRALAALAVQRPTAA